MVINHPVLNRFSPSIREVEPVVNDDKIIIPNTFQLVGLPPEPMFRVLSGGASISESSFICEHSINVVNAAANILNAVILRNGYWQLHLGIAYRSNYLGTGSAAGATINIDTGSGATPMLAVGTAIGGQVVSQTVDFMIQQASQVTFILQANGVAQDHAATFSMIGNKLL